MNIKGAALIKQRLKKEGECQVLQKAFTASLANSHTTQYFQAMDITSFLSTKVLFPLTQLMGSGKGEISLVV